MNELTEYRPNIKTESSKKCFKKKHPRNPFTKEEDKLLRRMVERYGERNWELISKKIPDRNERQCHDRWINYLSPKIINFPWTKEEDDLLDKKYEEFGPAWKKIACFFPYRTDINIKSRWNLRERRMKKEKLMIAKKKYYQGILSLNSVQIADKKDNSIENSIKGQNIDHNNNDYPKNSESQMKIGDKNVLSEEFLIELVKEFEYFDFY